MKLRSLLLIFTLSLNTFAQTSMVIRPEPEQAGQLIVCHWEYLCECIWVKGEGEVCYVTAKLVCD